MSVNQNKTLFMNRVLEDFCDEIKGTNKYKIIDNHPEEEILVGKLSPIHNQQNDENTSTTNISRIGMDFFITEETFINSTFNIKPKGEFYYRVFPTLEEQREYMLKQARNHFNKEFSTYNELVDFIQIDGKEYSQEVVSVFKKLSIPDDLIISITPREIYKEEKKIGIYSSEEDPGSKVNLYLDRIKEQIQDSKETYGMVRDNIELKHLRNKESWSELLRNYSRDKKAPKMNIGIECEIRKNGNEYKVSISIKNLTDTDTHKKDKVRSNTLFNSGLEVEVLNGDIKPIILPYFEDDYKYDKRQNAIGHNCTVLEEGDKLITTHLPIYEQKRLKTRDDIKAYFEDLIENPVQALEKISFEMDKEYKNWKDDYENNISNNLITEKGKDQFKKELDNFQIEINRFKNGIRVINEYELIREAFICTNKAFSTSSKGYASWRLFQIVFIVSNIPDVCTSEYTEDEMGPCYIDKVDLLYFPTGGGKTEAFLGITIFNLFFDRLRDKNAGVTAVIKYPLRLLSVQQVQRLADILAVAEIIRRDHEDMHDSEEFSLGYFVGDNNTPNKITDKIAEKFLNMTQKDLNDEYQVIDVCPYCREKLVNVEFIKEELRLVHRCSNNSCNSNGILPFYMVDREIYRYLPSVIISTIDKFASVGVQADFRNILGEVTQKCSDHGYSSRLSCTERGFCKDISKLERIKLKDPAPTLFIQDELHLIRESLGVYDSHYETFIQYFVRNLSSSRKKIKIIGATATISAYREQCNHLYLKDPIRFPCESPYLDRNFYAYVDNNETHRKIVGYAPFGKAIINSVVYSLKYLKIVLWKYYIEPELILDIPDMKLNNKEEALKLLEDYWIFLQYNNVKLDGNKVLSALDDPINTELKNENIQTFDPRKMTGDDSFQDVRKVLAEVETTKDVYKGLNLIAATSMISHGVDADKFNLMFFFGMPNNTAEYIQAYSRVGRKYPGLVFMIMRPTRDKDQSYLKNFIKFHEFKDILVEPVPINRWATKAIERTFPGILSGLLLNYYDFHLQKQLGNNIYMMSKLKEVILSEKINKAELINHIKLAYQSNSGSIGKIYDEWIESAVEKFFNNIEVEDFSPRSKRDVYITQGMEKLDFLIPMNSLRDTDTPIIVEMK
ncbi:helicase-related protein [Bacillus pinisoli]|uniref:helicase-related protein n=1 Tax=Bacillus pinisoli TaxID=2901866 RepID=UPI001FF47346|nr:helicase-related protein [Bacillus pinisoli]